MNVYKGRLLEKICKSKIEARPQRWSLHRFQILHYICGRFGCKTLVAIDSESHLTSFPSFCAPPSEVAVLFYLNLSRRPFLGQVVDFDLLLCTGFDSEHAVIFVCHIFTQRPMTDRKIGLLSTLESPTTMLRLDCSFYTFPTSSHHKLE